MHDETVEHALERLKASSRQSFDIGGLFSRNKVAHKWKATHDGLILVYRRPDRDNVIENFSNHWSAMYSRTREERMSIVIMIFEHEYNDVWPELFEKFEEWLVKNDAHLRPLKAILGNNIPNAALGMSGLEDA